MLSEETIQYYKSLWILVLYNWCTSSGQCNYILRYVLRCNCFNHLYVLAKHNFFKSEGMLFLFVEHQLDKNSTITGRYSEYEESLVVWSIITVMQSHVIYCLCLRWIWEIFLQFLSLCVVMCWACRWLDHVVDGDKQLWQFSVYEAVRVSGGPKHPLCSEWPAKTVYIIYQSLTWNLTQT